MDVLGCAKAPPTIGDTTASVGPLTASNSSVNGHHCNGRYLLCENNPSRGLKLALMDCPLAIPGRDAVFVLK